MKKVRKLLLRLAMRKHAENWFFGRARGDLDTRRKLLNQFRRIERHVRCDHSEKEMLVMVEFLLTSHLRGCMVECGCYQGGSSAKLSLVARVTGRKLFICDSFQGLPAPARGDGAFTDLSTGEESLFGEGKFASRIEIVRENVREFGDLSVCTFIPGFFQQSLPTLVNDSIAFAPCFVFSDADLISSTRDVIRNLWPALQDGGRLYTHDANLIGFVKGIMDPRFWTSEIGEEPPVIFGAGYGCGFGARNIAFISKSKDDHGTIG